MMNTEDLLHWNQNAGLWNITDFNVIESGTYFLGELPEIRESLLIKHIRKTDARLEKISSGSPEFISVLKTRFLSLAEYTLLVESSSDSQFYSTGAAPKTNPAKRSSFARLYFDLLKKSRYSPLLYQSNYHENNYLELFKIFLPHTKDFFFTPRPVPLKLNDMERHTFISGKSGSGKTELMKALFMQIQQHTHEKQQTSLVFLDVHGDVSESLLSLRMNLQKPERLIYMDPSLSREKVPCINPFYHTVTDPVMADLMCQQFCKAFIELMGETGLSLQMEVLLKPCIYVLLTNGQFGLSDLLDFFDDERNDELVILGKQTTHHTYRTFFESAFSNKKFALTKLSIYARLQSLLNHYVFYQMLNGKPTIDWQQALDEGKVILINLSKGKIGEQSSKALGKLIMATLLSVTLQRAYLPENKRKASYLMVDEAHNFATEIFETILSESRKYRLFITLATQSVTQFSNSLRDMVLNNSAVKLLGINGMPALKAQAGDFGLTYPQLQELRPYEFYLKIDHHAAIKINSPDFLLKNPKRYFLLSNEIKSLQQYLLDQSGIYRPVYDPASESRAENRKHQQNTIQKETETSSENVHIENSADSQTKTTQNEPPKKGRPAKYKL
ncbi:MULTISPECIES: type IV secretory system conjugative DNA transfer family protein [unclassified Chryseobacterium]|uniref:type IV secretory system conjugative DNA transfer family protein n=1 Tax=unclassified Chryseobacterium TaxID=2593645 RepID=UPI000D3421E3|nr:MULTISPECIES: DUF87 domain-containing protein [unclassified Chryseobacterium]PTT72605.1 hypothetical protein DBR25_14380 [Chryseobacterium sp. HMWF001]PVV50426.1 ATP-binding protein [Chryseobacterium sp. HMWF035]